MKKSVLDYLLKIRLPITLFVIIVSLALTYYVARPERDGVGNAPQQPINFSHKLHAGTMAIDCEYCHTSASKTRHASIPATNICMNCHTVAKKNSDGTFSDVNDENSIIHSHEYSCPGLPNSKIPHCAHDGDFERYFLQVSLYIKDYSWQETFNSIKKLSIEIKKYTNKGDRCLLISENRPEWFISDLSIMLSGSITVPAYTTYAERDYEYIINDCTPTVIFVSNLEQFNKVKNIIKNKDFIKKVFSFDNLENVNENEYQNINNLFSDFNNENNIPKTEINRKDPACIIYTSGTQGNPKGVILSHGGILNNCEGAIEILEPLIKKDQTRFLTWLPLSHSYEHTVQFVQITVSARVFYAESIDKLIKNMNDCSPEIMTAVPRFYQNLYQKINSSFNKATGFKKVLVQKMLNLGLKKIKKEPLNFIEKIQDRILEKIVRKKIISTKYL